MHLLAAQRGAIADEGEAIDLAQTPGDICVLSAADTELAALAAAQAARPADALTLRLVNAMRLGHPMSVDRWIEATGRHARVVVVRALGGRGYFAHLLDALAVMARRTGISLVVLPGDAKPDPELARYSNVDAEDARALWRYLVEGGATNAARFLDHASAMISDGQRPLGPVAVPHVGIWSATDGIVDFDRWNAVRNPSRPVAAVTFYRALVHGGQTAPIDALVDALSQRGLAPLPIFAASLKDPDNADAVARMLEAVAPRVVLNATAFSIASPGREHEPTVLDRTGAPVFQVVLATSEKRVWQESSRGLTARDLTMNVALPEVDGRVLTRAIAFKRAAEWDERTECDIVRSEPEPERIEFVAELAWRWATIPRDPAERRMAIVLANYPNRDGRIGNGVGLDTPAGTIEVLNALRGAGYDVGNPPDDGAALLDELLEGPTNASSAHRIERISLSLTDYRVAWSTLPTSVQTAVTERWGDPGDDPFFRSNEGGGRFALPAIRYGRTIVGVQPARGYNIDPKATYHDPDLVPPHGYLAFYAWLRRDAHAIVHMGKHGNLEWLPGKALALSAGCFPEAVFGPMPHVYPFIVNDPGEGSQAKRRAQAVIVDHLTPPLTRAEAHGPMRELEGLIDEYVEASIADPRRAKLLGRDILELARSSGVAEDIGLSDDVNVEDALETLDGWLCELKELQIRDGLHVFGRAPEGRLRTDLLCALARVPRGVDPGGAGLTRALANDLGLDFDPLGGSLGEAWTGAKPAVLAAVSDDPWRTTGDTVERLELLAARLVNGRTVCEPAWHATRAVLDEIDRTLGPAVDLCGAREIEGVLRALDGRFVAPGPSGAPSRGRPDVLPTGRNFYSVDTRSVPTPAAWELGRRSAELVVTRHVQDEGEWPAAVGLTCWGTANMRTGGDDLAQALALIGARPTWDAATRRVTGFEIVSLAELGRPRVDVTLRISGFFRDAFPDQIALFDRAARAVGALDEADDQNPIAARMRDETDRLRAAGLAEDAARHRVFGSMPGAYGAGLQALIDEGGWSERSDLAEAYLVWGGYAYGAREEGVAERGAFERRLSALDAVLHNQDNREHDLLDSDDYYQFEGGMSAAVEALRGNAPKTYHNDHSRPEHPRVRTLEEEIARVVRGRVTNPKWIAGVMRHGYKGAFEIAATVDYLFAFAATTNAVRDHHFDAVHDAVLGDETVRDWMAACNPNALAEMRSKLAEAIERGLWHPRSNSVRMELATREEENA